MQAVDRKQGINKAWPKNVVLLKLKIVNTDLGRGLGDEAVLDICPVFLQIKEGILCMWSAATVQVCTSTCEFFYGVLRGAQFSAYVR